jgi:hypothetical protein
MVAFAPLASEDNINSPSGKFRVRSAIINNATDIYKQSDSSYTFLWRTGEEPDFDVSNNGTVDSNINWDGVVVPDGPFIEQVVFKIGNFDVTGQDVFIGSGAVVIIIVILVGICCYCSYRKRERIAIEAKRASYHLRKMSHRVRRSMSIKLGKGDIGEFQDTP